MGGFASGGLAGDLYTERRASASRREFLKAAAMLGASTMVSASGLMAQTSLPTGGAQPNRIDV